MKVFVTEKQWMWFWIMGSIANLILIFIPPYWLSILNFIAFVISVYRAKQSYCLIRGDRNGSCCD